MKFIQENSICSRVNRGYSLIVTILVVILTVAGCKGKKSESPIWLLGLLGVSNSANTSVVPIIVVKTGQTTVHVAGDDGTHQSGIARSYTGPTQHGTYTSDYTTTDNATGLVWKSCSQGLSGANCATGTVATLNWTNAAIGANGCNALNSVNGGNGYAGIKTWRLPSRQELETLPHYGRSIPAINTTAFPATNSTAYWSSTTLASNTMSAWMVDFTNGGVNAPVKTVAYTVRCVSGLSREFSSNLTDNNDGTIKDNASGLVWQKCSQGQTTDATCSGTATTQSFTNAITYCSGLTLAGKTWRLPNINELKSIVDTTKASGNSIDVTAFPSIPGSFYWSSTTYQPETPIAWQVNFTSGALDIDMKSASAYVRCVSGP